MRPRTATRARSSRCRSWGRGWVSWSAGLRPTRRSRAGTACLCCGFMKTLRLWAMAAATTRCAATPGPGGGGWRLLSPSQGFVPLSFDPGEAYQFDWSHEYARLSGVTTKVKAAHMRLCYSRMQLVQIFPRESQEMVFEAHERAFRFFGGVCRRGIYDNMKTAVSMVFVGKECAYNRRFLELCSHHLVEPVACTPGAGWEKGQVERQVGDVRGRLFVPIPRGGSYAEINEWLMDRCIEDAKKRPHPTIEGKTVWQVFEEERPFLMAYRGPFDGFHATEVSVSKTCLVRFDNNHYSVAARAVGRTVDVRAYADRIVIRQDGETVAEHPRSFGRGFAPRTARRYTKPLGSPLLTTGTTSAVPLRGSIVHADRGSILDAD